MCPSSVIPKAGWPSQSQRELPSPIHRVFILRTVSHPIPAVLLSDPTHYLQPSRHLNYSGDHTRLFHSLVGRRAKCYSLTRAGIETM